MKILNLYAGIGGNRKLWGDEHDITAVELDPEIANIYKDYFPNDTVIVADAHEYLLNHYKEFDFIWSSPPCPTHSRARHWVALSGKIKPCYVDVKLWQEIILLKNYSNCLFVVENVKPYYDDFIKPDFKIGRHCFWSNINLSQQINVIENKVAFNYITGGDIRYGYNLNGLKLRNKQQILRNCVNPETGLHILNHVLGKKTQHRTNYELFG